MHKQEHTAFTAITMVNSCRTNPFSKGKKILVTNKPDKLRHGYGLKSIEKIVERYGGDIKQYYDGETASFHTIITLKEVPEELY